MSDLEIFRPRQASLMNRFMQSVRSITLGPFSAKDRELARLFGGSPSSAGVPVNETSAMNYSAVWAAVNLIAGHIASVPLILYKREENGGKTRFDKHPLYRLIHDRPNPQMGSAVFRRTLQAHKLVWGNGYAEIERGGDDRPVALWPLMPYAVQPFVDGGRLRYRVYNPTMKPIEFEARDILHIRGLGDDGTCGCSVIGKARESLGLGIAAERFGSTFFGNGSTFGGIISYPPGVGGNTQTRDDNRKALEKQHQGVDRAHRFLALYEGAKYEQIGIPPNDAQFLETREFQIEEVCRWFNIPPHKLKHLKRSTNNNIEHQSIEYVTDTLDPHWVDWEEELSMKLIAPLERSQQMIEHVREGLLRGDSAGRGEFYSKLFSLGAMTPNEIRSRENLNPIVGGDTVFVPLNTLPLDRLEDYVDAQIEGMKSKAAPEAPPKEDTAKDDEIKSLQTALELSRHATQLAEDARDVALATHAAESAARQALEQAHAEASRELSERTAREQEANKALDELSVRLAANAAEWDAWKATLEASLEMVRAERDAADEAVTVGVKRAADTVAKLEADRDAALALALQAEQERDAARLQASAFQQAAEDTETAAREAKAEADAKLAAMAGDVEASRQASAKTEADRDVALALAGQAEQERDAEKARVVEVAAERDAAQKAMSHTSEQAHLEWTRAEKAEADLAAIAVEAEALRTDVARARADIAAELEKQRTQKTVLLSAMRSLFVDASERVLNREIDRARKHQGTPEKLRAWMTTFYPMHAEICRGAFRPLVGPWTTVTGGDPGVLLERLVAEHITASESALRVVADSDDPDEMAANLERTLSRWEQERANGMADALVREGMAEHG